MIRRAIPRSIPGYQVPFASREMPMLWLGYRRRSGDGGHPRSRRRAEGDRSRPDDTTNAISIRKFFAKTAGVATTTTPPLMPRSFTPHSRSAAVRAGAGLSGADPEPLRSWSRAKPRPAACMRSANTG
jgi:hypothetical protein